MARLRFTPAARDDLKGIRRYIAQDDPSRALTFVEEMRAHCHRIADIPLNHPIDIRIDPTARKAVHGAYLIFYDSNDEGVIVLRVLHSAMDLTNQALRSE